MGTASKIVAVEAINAVLHDLGDGNCSEVILVTMAVSEMLRAGTELLNENFMHISGDRRPLGSVNGVRVRRIGRVVIVAKVGGVNCVCVAC